MHVVGAFSVLIICVSLISCDYWFGRGDDYGDPLVNVYADHNDLQREKAPFAPNERTVFAAIPDEEKMNKSDFGKYEIGSPLIRTNGQHLEP